MNVCRERITAKQMQFVRIQWETTPAAAIQVLLEMELIAQILMSAPQALMIVMRYQTVQT